MTKLIVGLGNIGKQYEKNIHNMGFLVVDKVADELNVSVKKNMCSSMVGECNVLGERVILAKPTTFMNASGIAVKGLVKKYNIDINKELLIISDDIDLDVTKVRVRLKGSAGTHNGLKSIVEHLQSTEFPRVRIGVGSKPEFMDLADFVLSNVKDVKAQDVGLEKGKEACLMFANGKSFDQIMQSVN